MSERKVSRYKNNVPATGRRHLYSRLLDYFSLFVVTYILFSIFYAIASRMPVVDNIAQKLVNQNGLIAEYIDSTHLQRLNEDHSELISIDDGAKDYILGIAKTSAYVHQVDFPYKQDNGTYLEYPVSIEETFIDDLTTYELDTMSYYYKYFKKNETSLNNYVYEDVDYKDDVDTYMYLKVMKVDETKFAADDDADLLARGEGASRFVVLNLENTTALANYYREDKTAQSLYDHIYGCYISGAQYGIKDVENNSAQYNKLLDEYGLIYQDLTLAIFVVYLISYVVSYLLMTFILRLICKEYTTLGQKVLGLAICDVHEMEPSGWRILGYHAINFVLFFSSTIIALYFMGMIGVFSLSIIGKFTVLALLLAILTLNIFSLFMPLFNKNNHHDLSTLISRIIVKDTKEFEGPVGMDDIADTPEEDNGRDS